jgi:hypothetical protein
LDMASEEDTEIPDPFDPAIDRSHAAFDVRSV